jgi:hypothetical protein
LVLLLLVVRRGFLRISYAVAMCVAAGIALANSVVWIAINSSDAARIFGALGNRPAMVAALKDITSMACYGLVFAACCVGGAGLVVFWQLVHRK